MYQYVTTENKMCEHLAMAYVPWQKLDHVYENLEEALYIGTIFPELDKPFERGACYGKN